MESEPTAVLQALACSPVSTSSFSLYAVTVSFFSLQKKKKRNGRKLSKPNLNLVTSIACNFVHREHIHIVIAYVTGVSDVVVSVIVFCSC